MRLLRIFLILSVLVILPFLVWGDTMMAMFDADRARLWIQGFGAWGWAATIVLLISDLVLPIPATGVMSAAGYVFGPWVGGLISVAGSSLGGLLGYGLSRWFGRGLAERFAGAEGLTQNEALFVRGGPWLVMLSRWLPVLPEVIACLAGLARMPFWTFLSALLCGTIPMGFAYAAIGSSFRTHPGWALALSIALPVVLWLAFRPLLRTRTANHPAPRPPTTPQ